MNCPNCGAALQAVSNRAHLRCPYCESLHFPAGTAEGVIPLDQDHPLDCPCCERQLSAAMLDGESIGYCPKCRGILLSSDDFAQVVTRRRESKAQPNRRVQPIDPAEFRRITRCPRCGRRTDTHTYGGGGNAVIDSCHRCRLV